MENYNIDDENQIIISKVEKGTLETLKNSINWTQPVVNIFGRTYYPKRQVCTMGKPYKYNGNITPFFKWISLYCIIFCLYSSIIILSIN